MRKISLLMFSLLAVAFLAAASFGQGTAVPPAQGKIGLINFAAFGDEKAGIAKYRSALGQVEAVVAPLTAELKALNTKYQAAVAEYQTMQKNPAVSQTQLTAKADEIRMLETTIKRKQEDAKAIYDKRYSDTMSPVMNDIFKALNEFAKQKGFAVILDGAKLEQADILVGFDDRYDVTKDFIAFYNVRPAGTAANVAPK